MVALLHGAALPGEAGGIPALQAPGTGQRVRPLVEVTPNQADLD